MDINLELYKVFYYVATTLSFSEASRQLFISQSAVSQSSQDSGKKTEPSPVYPKHQRKFCLLPKAKLLLQHVKASIAASG